MSRLSLGASLLIQFLLLQFEVHLNGIEASDEMYKVVGSGSDESLRQSSYRSESDEEESLAAALSVKALDIYRTRLKARHRRKRVVKEYGLLNKAKGKRVFLRFPRFYRLLLRYRGRSSHTC